MKTKKSPFTFNQPLSVSKADISPHRERKISGQCVAFTLAEVLITLGVIGVVAAMTLPTLVQKHQEKATVTRLKKIYSTVNESYRLAVLEYGTPDNWGLVNTSYDNSEENKGKQLYTDETITSHDLFVDILTKNLKVIERCTYDKCGRNTKQGSGSRVILADGTKLTGVFIQSPACKLSEKNICADIYFDFSNGKEKIAGKNYFAFWVTKNGLVPKGLQDDPFTPFNTTCPGQGCTAWIIFNENMDYLHCDGLSWNGKHKCK